MQDKIKHKDLWNFTYKGINCEIVHWGVNPGSEFMPDGTWNSYFYLREENLPEAFSKLLAKSKLFKLATREIRRWDSWKIESLFDMHGGVTYYQVIRDEFTGKKVGIKIGCDYAHSFDEGMGYEMEWVKKDLEETIDKVFERFPGLLVWRFKDGKYVKPEELVNS